MKHLLIEILSRVGVIGNFKKEIKMSKLQTIIQASVNQKNNEGVVPKALFYGDDAATLDFVKGVCQTTTSEDLEGKEPCGNDYDLVVIAEGKPNILWDIMPNIETVVFYENARTKMTPSAGLGQIIDRKGSVYNRLEFVDSETVCFYSKSRAVTDEVTAATTETVETTEETDTQPETPEVSYDSMAGFEDKRDGKFNWNPNQ